MVMFETVGNASAAEKRKPSTLAKLANPRDFTHTLENVQNRTYPLKSEVYFYAAMLPGQTMFVG